MSDLRKAAQAVVHAWDTDGPVSTMEDLRAALAQPEPVHRTMIEDFIMSLANEAIRTPEKSIHDLLMAIGYVRAAQPEPVGWFESPHGAFRANPLYKLEFPSQLLSWSVPLYTAPPQRKPLTEEEIHKVCGLGAVDIEFVRIVEKAHGIE